MPAPMKRWAFLRKRYGKKFSEKGFTLIELLSVIAIIGVAASIVVVGFNNTRKKSRDAERRSALIQIRLALELYYDAHGFLPWGDSAWIGSSLGYTNDIHTCNDGSAFLLGGWDPWHDLNQLVSENFIGQLPIDPINDDNHCYIYAPNPDLKGACVWANKELGNRRKIGITVGQPDPSIPSDGGPSGFLCNFIEDEVLGGVYLNPPSVCGNTICENGEQVSCPGDCPAGTPVCGDGYCAIGEICAFDCNAGSGS